MKKFLFCIMCIFYSSIAMADICYDISENVASIAMDWLDFYCNTTDDEVHKLTQNHGFCYRK